MTGVAGTVSANSADLVRLLAALSNGPAYPVSAPLVVSDAATARAFLAQPGIAAAVSRFGSIRCSTRRRSPRSPPRTWRPRCARRRSPWTAPWLDDGLAQRTAGIGIGALRRVPEVIAVAGGEPQARAIHDILGGGLA
jgi:DNA-binding transcriptional regulator LsrR (DeoR family)